jgi:hypothetical protein
MPHHKAIYIPFAANPGPTHLESIKWILFILSDIPDPPFIYSRTTEDFYIISGHRSSFNDNTLP